jgi:hypothetical protein
LWQSATANCSRTIIFLFFDNLVVDSKFQPVRDRTGGTCSCVSHLAVLAKGRVPLIDNQGLNLSLFLTARSQDRAIKANFFEGFDSGSE